MFRGVDHANICNNCIDDGFATMVKAGIKVKAAGDVSHKAAAAKSKAVSMSDVPKPKEIKEFLDNYVIGQDEAKRSIAVAVYERLDMRRRRGCHACSDFRRRRV